MAQGETIVAIQESTVARIVSGIAIASMGGFCGLLFVFRSPKALPVSALILVPIGVNVAWLVTGTRAVDLVPLLRRLKGWRLGVAIAAPWLALLYVVACLWWFVRG
jgi:hypothetical protein